MGLFARIFGETPQKTNPANDAARDGQASYVFLDVETPNKRNDTICSIGAIKTDTTGRVIDRLYTLVNPEVKFSSFNIGIHGIQPEDVADSPTFNTLWNDRLSSMLDGSILVAHNAQFDLTVLSKSLIRARIPTPDFNYVCTVEFGGDALSGYESCKLDAMCRAIGYDLVNHHNAMDDTEACMNIFWRSVEATGRLPKPSTYVFRSSYSPYSGSGSSFEHCDKTKALQYLKSYMEEAVKDKKITTDEAMVLQDLISSNEHLNGEVSLSKISNMLQSCLEDGWIDTNESRDLIDEFSYYLDPLTTDDGTVDFVSKNFMLTGDFVHGSKDSVAEYVSEMGGTMLKSVTKSCDYLVVGGRGSDAWSFGNYGNKVKKAMEWRAKGQPIRIISEETLYGHQ